MHNVEGLAGKDFIAELKRKYKLRIGDRPFVRSVRRLHPGKTQAPPEIEALRGETYMVTHAVGVSTEDGKPGRRTLLDTERHSRARDQSSSSSEHHVQGMVLR